MVSEQLISESLEKLTKNQSKEMSGKKYSIDILDKNFKKIDNIEAEIISVTYNRFDDCKYILVRDTKTGEIKNFNQFYIRMEEIK